MQSTDDKKKIGHDLEVVEFKWPVGMPLCRPLAGYSKLWEVRSTIKNGKVEARLIFAIDRKDLIVLHAFEKRPSSQNSDIGTAANRWKEYQRRKKEEA